LLFVGAPPKVNVEMEPGSAINHLAELADAQRLLFGLLLENAEAPIFVCENASDHFVAVNKAGAKMLGRSSAEVLGLSPAAVTARPLEELEHVYADVAESGSWTGAGLYKHADGQQHLIAATGLRVRIEGRTLLVFVADPAGPIDSAPARS
jgi:PAS domain S-box-containing protein